LLAAGNGDQAAFDKLWAYFEKNKNANGVMKWQTTACGAATAEGSATDGELDAAMALIQASCRWGASYDEKARELVTAIKNTELANCDGAVVLKPGDNFGGCERTNPSYVAPGYFKVFATFTSDTSWNTLADDGYALLATLQTAKSGLVPDWSDAAGTPATGEEGEYGPDASRTPWRVATDYVWFNEPRAVTFLDKLASYVDGNGGVARLFEPNSNFRGGLAMSALQSTGAKAQEYTDAWLTTSVDDDTYFPGTLRPLYMLLMAHQFPKGCN
jgi:endo-1,4-beta-D-glucanase Y